MHLEVLKLQLCGGMCVRAVGPARRHAGLLAGVSMCACLIVYLLGRSLEIAVHITEGVQYLEDRLQAILV